MRERTPLDIERVHEALHTDFVGRQIYWPPLLDSTMAEARRQLERGAAAGIVVGAESQTVGRGRRGRVWYDRPGRDLLFSVLLEVRPEVGSLLPIALGALLAEALQREAGCPILVQWPNNLVAQGAKLGGVLVEVVGDYYIVGLGLNVKGKATEISRQVERAATTLEAAAGRTLQRESVLVACLRAIEETYQQLSGGAWGPVLQRIEARSSVQGKLVTVTGPQGELRGRAVGIAADGSLLLRDQESTLKITVADALKVEAE